VLVAVFAAAGGAKLLDRNRSGKSLADSASRRGWLPRWAWCCRWSIWRVLEPSIPPPPRHRALRLLEAFWDYESERERRPRFYQAGSSEMFAVRLAALPDRLFVFAHAGAHEVRDLTLGVLEELDRDLAHAGQEFRLRAGHEESIQRMSLVLNP